MELIDRLTQLIRMERIYLNDFKYKGTRFSELIILLPNSAKMHITEARPLVSMALSDHPEYHFRIFYIQEIKRSLQSGSLVFYTICRDENLIYQSDCCHTILSSDLDAKAILKKAKRNFRLEWKKVSDFKKGFQFYLKEDNYPLAAFMLHQVIELSYRTAELLIMGREKISHAVRSHQRLMYRYVPELGVIFNPDDEEEMSLLTLLDDAYRSVRYELIYLINRNQLLEILSKADLMEKEIAALHKLVITQFKASMQAKEAFQ